MKRLFFLLIITFVFTSCGVYQSAVSELRTGMSKREVTYHLGRPERVIATNYTRQGYQEVLEYYDRYRDDFYALEFWDDYLVGYEYIDNRTYVPIYTRPSYVPDYGRPVVIIDNRPGRPSRPWGSSTSGRKPSRKPATNGRYNSNSGRDSQVSNGNSSGRKPDRSSTISGRQNSSSRPASGSSSNTSRDTKTSGRSSSRSSSTVGRSSTDTSTTSTPTRTTSSSGRSSHR